MKRHDSSRPEGAGQAATRPRPRTTRSRPRKSSANVPLMDHLTRDLESHRPLLTGHCYRMLGSIADADDAVQETMIRAWRALGGFDGRSSLRTWLVRIATNVCLDALAQRKRRVRPVDEYP